MCRFLLIKSDLQIKPNEILKQFAGMVKKSRTLDGDRQDDGWGISWINNNKKWQIFKSIKPIWEDFEAFNNFPPTNMFAVHARSASFVKDKGNIDYNQPFIDQSYSFVFNGFLKGVRLSSEEIPGKIGAQKIWYLLRKFLNETKPLLALKKIKKILIDNSNEVQALNIGLADRENIYALCYYSKHPNYYQLQYGNTSKLKIVSSEKFGNFNFQSIKKNKVVRL